MKLSAIPRWGILLLLLCCVNRADGATSSSVDQSGSGWLPIRSARTPEIPVFVFTPRESSFNKPDVFNDRVTVDGRVSPMALAEKIRFLRPAFELRDKLWNIPQKMSAVLPTGFFVPALMKDSGDGRKSGPDQQQKFEEKALSATGQRQTGEMPRDRYYLGYRCTNPDDEKHGFWFIAVGFRNSGGSQDRSGDRGGRSSADSAPELESDLSTSSVATKKEFQGPILGLVGKF